MARVTRRTLRPAEQVAFRCLGRAYGPVGGLALALALASGAMLLSRHPRDGQVTAATAAAGSLVAATVAGVVQARRMTRPRHRALGNPGDPRLARQVRREAITAAILRALIAALSLALGALLAG